MIAGHNVDVGRHQRAHLGPAFKPACSCGWVSPLRPTPDIEIARERVAGHLRVIRLREEYADAEAAPST